MSDNDDIEVESDVSPGASSFPFGLSGGDSGRGSQWGDGGRGPGRRRPRPLTPGLGPPASRSDSLPSSPVRRGLLGLKVGADTRPLGPPPPPVEESAEASLSTLPGWGSHYPSGSWARRPALRTCFLGPRSPSSRDLGMRGLGVL